MLKDGKFGAGEFFRWARVEDLMDRTQPTVVVVENFLLYKWKALELAWSPLYACRVLGVIEYLCEKRGIKLVTQTAAEGKSTRLKPIRGITNRHALDALKHALYFASREGYADAYSYLLSQRGKDDHSWPRDRLEPEKKP